MRRGIFSNEALFPTGIFETIFATILVAAREESARINFHLSPVRTPPRGPNLRWFDRSPTPVFFFPLTGAPLFFLS